jgi:hypothetical protein
MPVKKPSGLGLFRGLLLVWALLSGLLGGIFLLFGMVLNASGFGGQVYTGGGDGTMTASEVERAQAGTLALGLVVLLAVAAVIVFARQRKYRHPTLVLLGIAALQMVAFVFIDSWIG